MTGCPRILSGKRCLRHYPSGPCWCQTVLNDHGATYTHRDGHQVTVWEPYQVSPEELAMVTAAATRDGLHVAVSESGGSNPMKAHIEFSAI